MDFEGFISVDEHLLNNKKYAPINTDELSDIVAEITAHTGLTKSQAKDVLNLFFHEIRNFLLNGNIVILRGLGRFFIACPKNLTKHKIFIKFKPINQLIKKINGK